MLYILYSADYELFMSRNFLPEKEVLIQPSHELLDVCDSIGIPMTLFCDYLCLKWYREQGLNEFPDAIDLQLKDAVRKGHDVQTHIHPHWPCTRRNGDCFVYDHTKFLLGKCAQSPQAVYELAAGYFKESKEYFNDLLKPVDPDYECLAYRAGGYGVQPNDARIFQALEDAGYWIDSSVVPGMKLQNHVNEIDFTGLPKDRNFWAAGSGGLKHPAKPGCGVFEVPVAAGTLRAIDRLYILKEYAGILYRRGKDKYLGGKAPSPLRGQSIQENPPAAPMWTTLQKIKGKFGADWAYLECTPNLELMKRATVNFLNGREGQEDVYFSFSCHPKFMQREHFENLRRYHGWLKGAYGDGIQAISFRKCADLIRAKAGRAVK